MMRSKETLIEMENNTYYHGSLVISDSFNPDRMELLTIIMSIR